MLIYVGFDRCSRYAMLLKMLANRLDVHGIWAALKESIEIEKTEFSVPVSRDNQVGPMWIEQIHGPVNVGVVVDQSP